MANWKQILRSVGDYTVPLASSVIGGVFGMKQQSDYIEAQRLANEQAFLYNKELASLQNQYNLDQWNRQNAYDHPAQQMKRLQEAGLNPDLVFSGGAVNNTSGTSPSMVAGSPYQPADYTLGGNRKTVGDITQDALNQIMQTTQIKKLRAETIGQTEKNKSIFALDQAELQTHYINQGYTKQQTTNLVAELDNIKKMGAKLDSEISLNSALIRDVDNQILVRTIDLQLKSKEVEQRIKLLQKECDLTDAQVREIYSLLPHKIDQLVIQNSNAELQGEQISGQILLDTAEYVLKTTEASIASENLVIAKNNRKVSDMSMEEHRRKAYVRSLNVYKFAAGLADISGLIYNGAVHALTAIK